MLRQEMALREKRGTFSLRRSGPRCDPATLSPPQASCLALTEPLNPRTQSGRRSKWPHTASAVRQVHASPRPACEHRDFGQAAPPRCASVSPSAGWGDDNASPHPIHS